MSRIHLARPRTKKYVLLMVLFISSSMASGVDKNVRFDSVFNKVALDLTTSMPQRAIQVADSLYLNSDEPMHKMKALMLSAHIYQELNDRKSALLFSKRAIKKAEILKDYPWQARILGFISTQYRNIGLIEQGEKFLVQGISCVQKIQDDTQRATYGILMLQERAYYCYAKQQYLKGLSFLDQTDQLFKNLPSSGNTGYHRAISEELKARFYIKLEDYSSAEKSLLKAKAFLEPYQNTTYPLYGFIYAGLGQVFLSDKSSQDTALKYLNMALPYAEQSSNSNLKLVVYENFLEYYKGIGNWKQYGKINELLNKEKQSASDYKNETVSLLLNQSTIETTKLNGLKNLYLFISLGGLSLILLAFYGFRIRELKHLKKYNQTIHYLKSRQTRNGKLLSQYNVDQYSESKNQEVEKPRKGPEFTILNSTEKRILDKIDEFEEKLLFLESNISITYLASFCETNIRYMSKILKDNKKQDFNTYVNTLKVYYIIKMIKEDKKYRSYKISYLAEISGFSSHSKFSSVFKQVVGLSPSQFIELHSKIETTDT